MKRMTGIVLGDFAAGKTYPEIFLLKKRFAEDKKHEACNERRGQNSSIIQQQPLRVIRDSIFV
jgi:hypothetical protein